MRSVTEIWYLIIMQSPKWLASFDGFYISHVSRSHNTKVDALAALAATLALPIDMTYHLTVATRHLVCPKHVLKTKEVHSISTDFEPRD